PCGRRAGSDRPLPAGPGRRVAGKLGAVRSCGLHGQCMEAVAMSATTEEMNDDSTEMTAILRRRLSEQPLWAFALALYACPGVEAACLALQDEAGVDVCELLWRCWLLHHGARPGPAAEAGLREVRRWQAEVTAPLRTLRRRLKPEAA